MPVVKAASNHTCRLVATRRCDFEPRMGKPDLHSAVFAVSVIEVCKYVYVCDSVCHYPCKANELNVWRKLISKSTKLCSVSLTCACELSGV